MRARRFLWGMAVVLVAGAVIAPATAAQAIVGGYPQNPSQYPYFVRFDSPGRCGGAVIAPDVVLTAAHCVDAGTTPSQISMVLTNSSSPGARSIRIHPLWNGQAEDGHDLAIIETNPGGTAGITPVQAGEPFPEGVSPYAPGTPTTVLGRGRTTPGGGLATQLMGFDSVIRSDDFMDDIYNSPFWFDHWNSQLMIGTGDSSHTICDGDSGGPLLSFPTTKPVLVGVASFVETWPDECGEAGGFAELAGPQLAWVGSQLPAVIESWGVCTAPGGVPGFPSVHYSTTPAAGAQRDGSFYWRIRCDVQPDRLGPSIAVSPSGHWQIAFQANTGALWVRTSDVVAGPVPGSPALRPGTSPSIAAAPSGGYWIAYQASDGMLGIVSPTGQVTNLGLGLAPGTSPSIAVSPSGQWQIAFQANTGVLWTRTSAVDGGPVAGNPIVKTRTSPSIVAVGGGGYQITYQAANGMLSAVFPEGQAVSLGQGMSAGSSPSLAPVGANGGWIAAVEANTGMLWKITSALELEDLRLGMPLGS